MTSENIIKTVADLMLDLSAYDPACLIKVLTTTTEWGYSEDTGSFPIDTAEWVEPTITQKADGTIHIGIDGRM